MSSAYVAASNAAAFAGWTTLIIALSGAFVTLVGSALTRASNREVVKEQRKANSLAVQREQHEMYRDLTIELRAELERVRTARSSEHDECRARIAQLRAALIERGVDPDHL
jgi:ABC-type hemin transport system ATPase subunit